MFFTLNAIVLSVTVLMIGAPVITGLIGNFEDPEAGKSVYNY